MLRSAALGCRTPRSGTEDRAFTITPQDNASAVKIDVSWGTPEDYDLEVYRKNADGTLTQVGSSGNSPGQAEEVVLEGDKAAPGDYVLRVVNFAAAVGSGPRPSGATRRRPR